MSHFFKRFSILVPVAIMSLLLLVPFSLAEAEVEGSAVQQDMVENSWRFSNGVPTNPTDDEMTAGSLSLSLQADEVPSVRSTLILKPIGIDVSHHQGTIDWKKVAQTNVEYAIIQCGYGSDTETQDDRQWLNNVKGCQENGIPFGVYLYSYAYDVEMATSEGWHVVHALQRAGLTPNDIRFPIYYDIEQSTPEEKYGDLTPEDYNAMWLAFKKVLNDAGYTKVGVYASASWWEDHLNQISLDEKYIWYARYGKNEPDKPLQPSDDPFAGFNSLREKSLGIWQYSSVGKVDGIEGNVDMNYCRIDLPFYYPKGSTLDMYRLYNASSGEHLYTTDGVECGELTKLGWRYEGVGWIAPKETTQPVYRLYNPHAPGGDHHYTMDKVEYDYLCTIGWKGEGVGWYSDENKNVALYRLFNPNEKTGTHHYTTDVKERDHLDSIGWKYEGICWHGC